MAVEQISKIPESINFNAACTLGLRREHLSAETWAELRGIEQAFLTMNQDPWFEAQFATRRVSIDEILDRASDLEQFLYEVVTVTRCRKQKEHLRQWAGRMIDLASGDEKVVDFVERHRVTFGLDNLDQQV